MAEQVMRVVVVGDDSSLLRMARRDEKAIAALGTTTNKSLSKVDAAFTKTQRIAAGGFIGGAALTAAIAGIRTTTDAASDLQEQVSKSGQVFGESSRDVVAWSKTTSEAIGISQTAALEATGTFGNLFTAIGIGEQDAAQTSKRLVTLAADLASFNNADPTDVLTALRAGLVGEVEPLRRFGVQLNEARVQQVALAQTGKDNVKALTAQEKALARVSIIFDDTTKAQGDFLRTSESLANQQRILAARTADLQANLGQLLLPAVTAITTELVEATDVAIKLADALRGLGDVKIPAIRVPIVGEIGGGGVDSQVFEFLGNALDPKKIALRMNPAGLVALTALEIREQLEAGKVNVRHDLAQQFADTFNGLVQDVFDDGVDQVKPPKTKGFGTGLTPQDLYGPLIKGVTNAQKEALLDAERLTPKDFGDDLAALLTTRSALLEALDDPRLRAKGRLEIKQALDSVQGQIDSINSEVASGVKKANDKKKDAAEKARKAAEDAKKRQREDFDELFASLSLAFDKAEVTHRLSDDLRTNDALQKAVQAQIKVEGRTAELLEELFGLQQKEAEIRKAREQGRQFRALGLSREGEEIVPGVENLEKRLRGVFRRIASGDLDVGSKLAERLRLSAKLIRKEGKNLSEETRDVINDWIKEATGGQDKANKLILRRPIDLDRIFGQFSPRGAFTAVGPRGTATTGAAAGVNITGPITVVADDPNAFLAELQKKAGRSSATARGRYPGQSLGLG